ncbi:MAG: hypothetical protein M0000_04790 [Actinomycetota bacterium]|nr:hypothetical protein [Actinomycetota bacterium]MDA8207877.1 hypothetical protein [Actinomycetota bacterium]
MAKSAGEEIRDLAYVAVGFGVLGLQRIMVARRDLEKVVSKGFGGLAGRGPFPRSGS